MNIIKSMPDMTRTELQSALEQANVGARAQAEAMTELGKLTDMQQARIAALGWQPLTPETQWEFQTEIGLWMDEWGNTPRHWHFSLWLKGESSDAIMNGVYWMERSYTHFRRLNPPAAATEPKP